MEIHHIPQPRSPVLPSPKRSKDGLSLHPQPNLGVFLNSGQCKLNISFKQAPPAQKMQIIGIMISRLAWAIRN